MFVTCVNPQGHVTSLDLTALASWRLELTDMCLQSDASPDRKQWLAVGFRYMAEGRAVFQAVAALKFAMTDGELVQVVRTGLPKGKSVADKERLSESLAILNNIDTVSKREVEEAIEKGAKLATIYHDIRSTLFSSTHPSVAAGPLLVGEFEGWHYAISRERFASVLEAPVSGEAGLGVPPGRTISNTPDDEEANKPSDGLGPPPTVAGASKGKSRRTPPA